MESSGLELHFDRLSISLHVLDKQLELEQIFPKIFMSKNYSSRTMMKPVG